MQIGKVRRSPVGSCDQVVESAIEFSSLFEKSGGRSLPYRPRLMLFFLAVIYFLNFVDRQIILILQEPIRAEFSLSDTQLGLLTGGAFGLLYTLLSLPLARWLDHGVNRVRFIGAVTTAWSVLTIICGLARSFGQLFTARMCVGMAEAGFTPAAHSLISDIYVPKERPQAIGLFALSVPIGVMAGLSIGGIIAQAYDWRTALLVAGLPGIMVAILFVVVLREPARGAMDPLGHAETHGGSFGLLRSIAILAKRPAFRHVILSAAVCSFAQAGFATWLPSFLIRVHGMGLSEAGVGLGLLIGTSGILGTYFGGWQATRMAQRGQHRMLWIPMFGAVASVPLLISAFTASSPQSVQAQLFLPLVLCGLWTAPSIALTQNLAPVAMRAQASAVYVVCANLIGVSMGPLAVGFMSDTFSQQLGDPALGLRAALITVTGILIWGAAHHWLAMRHMRREENAAQG